MRLTPIPIAAFLALALALPAWSQSSSSSSSSAGSGGGSAQTATGALSSGRMGDQGMVPHDSTVGERTATGAIANERLTDEGVPTRTSPGRDWTATGALADEALTQQGQIPRDTIPDRNLRNPEIQDIPAGARDTGTLGEAPDGTPSSSPVTGGPQPPDLNLPGSVD